jgi:hypothetical protein
VLRRVLATPGSSLLYSQFKSAAGLGIFGFALEANGYTPYGRKTGLLGDGIQSKGGRQCAFCSTREYNHKTDTHTFVPAKYVLLTGDASISPRNATYIEAEKNPEIGYSSLRQMGANLSGQAETVNVAKSSLGKLTSIDTTLKKLAMNGTVKSGANSTWPGGTA